MANRADIMSPSVREEESPHIVAAIQFHEFLSKFLIEKFDQLFCMKAAKGKDYVVVFKNPKESESPSARFFSQKSQVKRFIKKHPEAACGYRNFHDFAYYL